MDPTKPDVPVPSAALDHAFASLTESIAGTLELHIDGQVIPLDQLASVAEERLRGEDVAQRARALYVLSLLRLLEYMREDMGGKDQHQQAAVALRYVQHTEEKNLAALQPGRTSSDPALKRQIDKVREELAQLTTYKAKAEANKAN